jgi:Phosphotransferase enzyme family
MPLAGGMGSGGAVVRVGDTVRRPLRPHSPSVARFLQHLSARGFDAAPRPLGIDERGREILSWIDGDVGVPPFPDWIADGRLLTSVARLQHRLHVASTGFALRTDDVWDTANLPPPPPNAVVCHNDLCVENVVVSGSEAVGVIDFDFAAPAAIHFNIAVACRHWVPFKDPADIDDARSDGDLVGRFSSFCAAYGLDAAGRAAVVGHAGPFLDRAMVSMKARADAGNALYEHVWNNGYPEQNRRSRAWLDAHAAALAA